ncbi:tyrosine-type recombinase/integrase [Dyella sp. Tek66A03]|uniref:tyrosine-type recombinase/integrase n=1 Tax=Dyella sp. Tek66A03 TaxID=3458298 RepID=UPI00403EE1CB
MHLQTSNVVPLPRQPLRAKLTDARVRSQPCPAKGSTYVYDTEVAGLALRITANGARTFVLYRRIKGRPERVTLGKVGMLSLGAARDAARAWIGRAAMGVDVRAQVKRDRMRGATVAHLFKQWHDNASTRGLRSLAQDKALWDRWVLPSLGKREAQGVSSSDVEGLSRRVGAQHPRTANKIVALLSRVFALALRRGEVEKNPAHGVARFPETVRERVLGPAEVRQLLAACEQEPEWGDYFRLLLMTGARRTAVAAMRWCDVDLAAGVWTVPSWASKNKKPIAVALIPLAVAVLKGRDAAGLSSTWVFPSPTSASGHLETPTKPWARICAVAGLQGVVIHDLRRTIGTLLAANGASTHVISAALGHLSTRSAEAYVHLGTAAVREHLTAVTQVWGPGCDS